MSFMVNKADLDAALKRTTIMVDKKVSRIIFKISSGVLKLISPESDIGTADEEIPCRYDGRDISMALNFNYVTDPLKVIDSENIIFDFNKFKNWKIIALVILILFALNKCTQSCNRANKIDKLSKEIVIKDSIIEVKENQVKALVRDTTDYANQIRMYSKFGKQTNEYIRQRNITDSINAINAAKQKAQTDALIKQIKKQSNEKK